MLIPATNRGKLLFAIFLGVAGTLIGCHRDSPNGIAAYWVYMSSHLALLFGTVVLCGHGLWIWSEHSRRHLKKTTRSDS